MELKSLKKLMWQSKTDDERSGCAEDVGCGVVFDTGRMLRQLPSQTIGGQITKFA